MNKFKKLFVALLVTSFSITFFLGFLISPVSAQGSSGTWYDQSYNEWSQKVFDESNPGEIFGERYTYAQVTWIIHSLTAIMSNPETSKCANKFIAKELDAFKECVELMGSLSGRNSASSSIVGFLAGMGNSLMNQRAASGTEYVLTTASKLHLIPEANAQGVGFQAIQPIQVLWRAVRNISYTLMTLIFIIMSFAIMFRVKISPQVVISVQSALPRLAMALIFITFSYAIAGFIIDLAYVSLGVVSVLLKTTGGEISSLSSIDLFSQLNSGNGLVSIAAGLVLFVLIGLALIVVASFTPLGFAVTVGVAIIILILFIILAVILFRLFWTMLKTTLSIIILTVGAPIFILVGVMPNAGGVGAWMRSLIANVAVYPTIAIMVFLSHYFFWAWFSHNNTLIDLIIGLQPLNTYGINKGIIASQTVTLPGFSISTDMLGFLSSLGILFLAPAAAEMVKSFFEGKPFAYGSAIGQATNPMGIRSLAQETAGTFLGLQLFDPKTGKGALIDLFNKMRSGRGSRGGTAGGGPTP